MENYKNETRLIKWIVLLPIIAVLITSSSLTYIFIKSKYDSYSAEIKILEKDYISNTKNKIKKRVDNISHLIKNNYKYQLSESKKNIKNIVELGFTLLDTVYSENKDTSIEKLFKEIDKHMNKIRFFENQSGYFFVFDLEKNKVITLPSNPEFVGKTVDETFDSYGKKLFNYHKKLLKEKNEFYSVWFWKKPDKDNKLEKVGYIKKFEPLNVMIGTAVYTEDVKETITKSIIDIISKMEYSDDSYIFILDRKGKSVYHKNQDIIGVPLEKLSEKTQENVNIILEKINKDKSGFLEYMQDKNIFENFIPSKKISYVTYNPELDWIIGTGLYTNDLNEQILLKRKNLEDKMNQDIKLILLISFVVSLIIITLLMIISNKIKELILYYSQTLNIKNKELKVLNTDLEKKVKSQVNDLRKKDFVLNQQSKLVAMGEMIGNIAHQWRQPLSAISTLASGIRVQKEIGLVSDEQLDEDLKNIVETTNILSNTIDDFRNFYSNKKEKAEFEIESIINQVLNLVGANLKSKNIDIIKNIDNINIYSYKNEFLQVILNLINNSKDALVELNEEKKFIFINVKDNKTSLCFEIIDNGGGIDDNIINRIFEPYFTTKFKSQGTGIGLFMSKNIIDNSLHGNIRVENTEFEYENKKYKGAKFVIDIPYSDI